MSFLEEKILKDGILKEGNILKEGGSIVRRMGYRVESIAIIDEMDCKTQTVRFRKQD